MVHISVDGKLLIWKVINMFLEGKSFVCVNHISNNHFVHMFPFPLSCFHSLHLCKHSLTIEEDVKKDHLDQPSFPSYVSRLV